MKRIAEFEKVSKQNYLTALDMPNADLIYEDIKLPTRATTGSAGYDFFAPFEFTLKPNQTITIPTGVRAKIEEGYVLQIYPRSGLGFKFRVRLDNTVGIIDADYCNAPNEGHIFVKITNEGAKTLHVPAKNAFAQGIFTQCHDQLRCRRR